MKYAIITPTYVHHFKFIDKYLKSFDTFVEDKKDIPIFFTISKTEQVEFEKIISNYKNNLQINILFIEDLFFENKIHETADEYLEKYGRFTFQTLKKFLTMLHVDAEKFLVLDCESMWVKKTNMSQLFNNYFDQPFLLVSDIDTLKRKDPCFNQVLENIYYLLDIKGEKKWFIEHFMWFYEKNILVQMFKEYGSISKLVKTLYEKNKKLDMINDLRFGIFEIVLYYAYLYKNNDIYGYKVVSLNKVMKKHMLENHYKDYLDWQIYRFNGSCGIIEHALILSNIANNVPLAQVFKELKLNIIRCEYSDLQNYPLQKEFLDIVQPNILAASQAHAFGLNHGQVMLIKQTKHYKKLCTHIHNFAHFMRNFLEPFAILYYFGKLVCYLPRFYKRYKF